MKLSPAQLQQYERDGFVIVPGMFSAQEVALLKGELARVGGVEADCIIRERTGGVAKAIYRAHEPDGPTASAPFRALVRTPRLLEPARQILRDDELYIYHCKCNLKTAIDGSIWQWHQDYGNWKHDGTPAPEMTTALLMLDEATEANGCLYFIPGSHKLGVIEPEMDDRTTSYRLWVVPKERLLAIMDESPEPVAITGTPGTVAFFHPNILHGSGHNMSRHDRWQAYLVYNRVVNHPRDVPNPRPDYVRSTNWAPLELGSEDLLEVRQPAPA